MSRRLPLSAVCELVTDGTHYTPANQASGLPFLTVKDMTWERLDFDRCSRISERDFIRADAAGCVPRNGDVLFSKDGTVGKVHVVSEAQRFAVLSSIAIMRPIAAQLDSKYLAHVLKSAEILGTAIQRKTGSAIRRIILKDLKAIEIPLPALAEQKRIAAILDAADALRIKRLQAIAKLYLLRANVFSDMFGREASRSFEHQKLGDVAQFFAGNSLPTCTEFSGQADGFLLAKVSDMNFEGNEIYLHRTAVWTRSAAAKAATCPADSVIIPKRGGAIGTNKKRLTTRLTVLDPNLMGIHGKPDLLDPYYLFQWFEAFDLTSIASGSSVPQLNKRDLQPLEIPVPPMSLQKTFRKYIEKHELTLRRMTQSAGKIDSVINALMQRAFRGEL